MGWTCKTLKLKLIGKICVKTSFIWVGNNEAERNEIVALYSKIYPMLNENEKKKIVFYREDAR